MSTYMEGVLKRRSVYGISAKSALQDEEIRTLVKTALLHTPSAYNSQSARAVLLLGAEHAALWDIVSQALKKIVPAEKFAVTQKKLSSFAAGYGSVMFFEDQDVIAQMQKEVPSFAEIFPSWSLQSSGMLQHVVWTALAAEGLGASLQHYNPLIDEAVRERWNLPKSWRLYSQMPFGTQTFPPDEKEFEPIETRFKSFGA